MRLHGKRHKRDRFYFRVHYGKQRMVYITKQYVDKPTEKQVSAREAFTELRREVARQLHDPILRARWEARFHQDSQGYKMLHTYVYAMMKRGESVAVETRLKRVSTSETPIIVIWHGVIMPIFLPWKVPKQENIEDLDVNEKNSNFAGKIICL